MSYTINKSNGGVLTTILDGDKDQNSTDLTLFGKKFNSYGELLNENFVFLLENFADSNAPVHPIAGQLWFNTATQQLNVYNGSDFISNIAPVVADTKPPIMQAGNFWIDSNKQQLHFNVNSTTSVLAGPIYTQQQGVSGFDVLTVTDSTLAQNSHTVLLVKTGGALVGIFSNDSFDILNSTIPAFNMTRIEKGFNTLPAVICQTTAQRCQTLTTTTGTTVSAENLIQSQVTGLQTIVGPLAVGPATDDTHVVSKLYVDTRYPATPSDYRIKTNIIKIDNALAKVQQLSGYTFDRSDISCPTQTGVIAQEVLQVLPEAVIGSDNTTYAVAYGNMVGLLIEAIKEQQLHIDELKTQVAGLIKLNKE